ncbi:MAG TPA: response regulator [Blastocatellia bacterium]|nr:response regulator [Blastocatellia bacterium]
MGYKILLVDDSVTVQKIITLTFSDEGVDVLTVNNGDEAIHRLQYMRPALVMADVSIPGKNGYEICEYVKNHPEMKDTPVVLLVPAFEPFDEERARRIGADKHLTKPFQSIRTLITTVKTLLEGHPPKFATGSLNNTVAQVQAPEPPKAPVVEAAVAAPVIPIRPTQPFPDEPEPEVIPEMEPVAEAPVVDIWKSEEVLEVEEILDVETEPELLAPELPVEIEEVEPVIEAVLPIEAPEPEPVLFTNPVNPQVTDSVTQSSVEVLGNAPAIVEPVSVEEPVITATEPVSVKVPVVSAAEPIVQRGNTGDLDHVLDLDDVLSWPTAPAIETPQIIVPPVPSVAAAESVIPQAVIDEIVNRVVAQLSEKLTVQLASQLAPEVVELVKQQTHHEAVAVPPPIKSDTDSLLDLD